MGPETLRYKDRQRGRDMERHRETQRCRDRARDTEVQDRHREGETWRDTETPQQGGRMGAQSAG